MLLSAYSSSIRPSPSSGLRFSSYSSMASSSAIPYVVDMAELRANGLGVPLLFPVDAQGFAIISSLRPNIRFELQDTSVWIEREVCNPVTLLFTHTILEVSSISEDGLTV